jgi:uncharacterized alkaline shock family protein YloU
MALSPDGDRLPCGQHIGQLWNHLTSGRSGEHAAACQHCQAALSEIRPLLQATSELAAELVSPPDDLSPRIMSVIRARIHPAVRIPLAGPAGMRLDITEHAAAVILRAAGDTIDGVRVRSCRLTPARQDGQTSAGLKLSISLRYGIAAPAAATAVRAAVRAAATRQLDLTLADIDIDVADIHLT